MLHSHQKPFRWIFLIHYTVTGITWNGVTLPFRREFNAIFIDFPEVLKPGTDQVIRIAYKGKPINAPNPPWDGGFVWQHDKNKDLWLGVACEHLGASSWWPTKDHLSDKPDSMLINLDNTFGIPGCFEREPEKNVPC